MPAIDVRLVQSHDEYAACEAMSRDVWGAAERNVVPRELLLTMQLNGGLVHGAFVSDGRLAGFCFGFAGLRTGRLRLCSHQLGVLPEFRGRGIGIALKQAQRRDALRLGYELITWTFDPLEARLSSLFGLYASQSSSLVPLHSLGLISIQAEGTFGRLRYSLGGDRPSQTAHLPRSARPIRAHVRSKTN